jgi:tripartite-type tricarboxylate transporter receptor subunit TctC
MPIEKMTLRARLHGACAHWLPLTALAVGIVGANPAPAQGQPADYPSKPVMIVVGFSAGSTNDASARVIAKRLSETFGQQFIVVNREGAAGAVSGAMVAKARPDGHTLLWASSATLVTGPAFHGNAAYDPVADFAPVGVFCYLPYVMVINPAVPAENLNALLDLARKQPGKLAYGSTGQGGTLHLAIELMQHMSKVRMVHVPYKGTPSLIVDLLSGQIQLGVMSVNLVAPHVKTGKMRAVAVTSNQRTGLLPDVPTVDESGLKGYDVRGWYGVVAPARTPNGIVTALNKAIAQALEHPEPRAVIAREGARPGGESPEHFAQFLRSERDVYRKLIADANLRKE